MKIPAFVDRLPLGLRGPVRFLIEHDNAVLFLGGFVFDMVTIQRIDSWVDLAIQFFYMTVLTLLLIYQYREHRGVWKVPSGITTIDVRTAPTHDLYFFQKARHPPAAAP